MNLGAERFDFRIIAWLCLATGMTLIPFAVHHAAVGETVLAALVGGLALLLIGVAYGIWRRGSVNAALVYAVLIGGNLVTVLAVQFLNELAVYWAFPLVAANLIFLQPRAGLTLNAFFAAAVLIVASRWAPPQELSRIAAALFILTTCVYFFSYYVTRQQAELRRLAAVDPLTGAGNRRALQTALEETVQSQRRYGCSASLLVLDLDHFKRINDTLGHDRGDQLLSDLVALLKRRLRNTDRVFRYGGEEFVVVTPHTPLTMASRLAEDIRRAVDDPELFTYPVTTSVGIVELQPDESAEAWLKRGDEALYAAKAQGRNCAIAHGECSGVRHNPAVAFAESCESATP